MTGKQRTPILAILIAVLMATAAVGALVFTSPASGVTLKQRLNSVEKQLNVLYSQQDVVVEQYDNAMTQLQAVNDKITANQKQLQVTQFELNIARADLAQQVIAGYKQGQVDIVAVILNTQSFDQLLSQFDALQRFSTQASQTVDTVELAKQRVVTLQAALTADKQSAQQLLTETQQKKDAVRALIGREQNVAKGLQSQIKAQERAAALAAQRAAEAAAKRAAAAAAAQKAAAAAAAAAAASAAQNNGGNGGGTTSDSGSSSIPIPVVNPGGPGHPEVVAIAQRYLGVPYVWGGASPSGFDCSGLVMYVYAQIGIHLPHGATMQQAMSTPVPLGSLQPGDLVFFGGPSFSHHVGIYVGGGMMINAPHTGAVVSYASVASFGDAWIGGRF